MAAEVISSTPDTEFWHLDLSSMRAVIERATESMESVQVPYSAQDLVDRMAHLETLQNALAALQSATVYAFARTHAADRIASGIAGSPFAPS